MKNKIKPTQRIFIASASLVILLSLAACGKNPAPDNAAATDSSETRTHAEMAENDGHEIDSAEAKEIPGPNGGRLIHSVEPHAEFLLREDRTVQISFFDEQLQPVAPSDQTVGLTGGDRSSPFHLSFKRSGDVLVSESAIPEGDDLPIVLNIKSSQHPQGVYEKFHLNLSSCPSCKYSEYACICGHSDDDAH